METQDDGVIKIDCTKLPEAKLYTLENARHILFEYWRLQEDVEFRANRIFQFYKAARKEHLNKYIRNGYEFYQINHHDIEYRKDNQNDWGYDAVTLPLELLFSETWQDDIMKDINEEKQRRFLEVLVT